MKLLHPQFSKFFRVLFLFLVSIFHPGISFSQCTISASIDIEMADPYTLEISLAPADILLSANAIPYAWKWSVNNDSLFTGNNSQFVPSYKLPAGFSEICLSAYATDTITGDSCYKKHCNIFTGTGNTIFNYMQVQNDADPLTKHFILDNFGTWPLTWHTLHFGDGTSTISAGGTSHTYSAPGAYNVMFGNNTLGTTSKTVNVDNGLTTPNIPASSTLQNYCDSISMNFPNLTYSTYFSYDPGNGVASSGSISSMVTQVPGQIVIGGLFNFPNAGNTHHYFKYFADECGIIPDTASGYIWEDLDNDGLKDSSETAATAFTGVSNYNAYPDSTGFYQMLLPNYPVVMGINYNPGDYILSGSNIYNLSPADSLLKKNCNFSFLPLFVSISGTIFLDLNNDSIYNGGDLPADNITVSAWDSIADKTYYSNTNQGIYNFKLPQGSYKIQPGNLPVDSAILYSNFILINAYQIGNYSGNNFAFHTTLTGANAGLNLSVTAHPRPGFDYKFRSRIINSGIEPVAGTLTVNYDPALFIDTNYTYPGILDSLNHTITLNVDTLDPMESVSYDFSYIVPVGLSLGSILANSAIFEISPGFTDYDSLNNSAELNDVVIGSFDPNNKLVSPSGYGLSGDIHHDQRLNYRINFQNTGTASAINVIVQDMIDEDLDINSFRMERTSHNYHLISNGNELTWKFLNIHLPDSNNNEPMSHGFIEYSIKPKSNLQDGTEVVNYADIYFDFNEPVRTDTTLNTLQSSITNIQESEPALNRIFTYPVPFKSELNIIYTPLRDCMLNLSIHDISGREIEKIYSGYFKKGSHIRYSGETLSGGIYFLKFNTPSEILFKKVIRF